MSNLGFRLAWTSAGIHVVETPVGDRYVLEAMLAGGYVLGGEQSGHIILLDHATTGDGMLTAPAPARRGGPPRCDAGRSGQGHDQVPAGADQRPGSTRRARRLQPRSPRPSATAEAELGTSGRVLVRPSGTEPKIRVMVEAVDTHQAESIARRVANVIQTTLA